MYRIQLFVLLAIAVTSLAVETATGDDKLSYNRDVRPILADKCFACHGADSAARKADLRLDNRDSAIELGAIKPGSIDDSELIARVITDSADEIMPPPELKKALTESEIATLKRWVAQGAEYESHWSFITPTKPALPRVATEGWAKTPIDHFILRQLELVGLEPAAEADPRTLIRRIHLDVTGLPPKPELVEKFVREYASEGDAALSRWINNLMDQPSWGEQRARYWLDAARYGDTHGLHFDNYREMWPYRDWVIRSFNADQPFDQFTIEQLAGDLLTNPTRDQLVATGFQRCNITTNEGGTIDEENLANYAADRVQTLGWVYLGLTTNCAQCHDHKFDPVTMKDYYSLAAFFRNTTQRAKDNNAADGGGPVIRVPSEADRPRYDALPAEIATAKAQRDDRRAAAQTDFQQWLAQQAPDMLESTLPSDSMIVYAPLTEGQGNAAINQCTTQPLTPTGEIAWQPDGKLGAAPVMKEGSTFDLGDLGDFDRANSFTVSAWIKPNNNNSSGAVVARMDVGSQYRGWDLWYESRAIGMHFIDAWPDNALKVVTDKPVLNQGTWSHVMATYDGSGKASGIKLYVDGKLQKSRVATENLKPDAVTLSNTSLRIGQRSGKEIFDGAIQDVRLYTKTLGDSDSSLLATVGPLVALLKKRADARSPAEQEQLFQHYLKTSDQAYQQLDQQVATLEGELSEIEKRSPLTHIQQEKADTAPMANVLMRGEYDRVGDEVTARTPLSLPPMPPGAPTNRLGLAQWLVDSQNPLVARVAVNRFWQQVFGQGLVVTPEDFGVSGAMPTHPELLDWLAVDLQENGWKVKRFFHQIFMSAAYRQSARATANKLELDVTNALLSRGPRFRMDAEMVRDYALSVSGLMSPQMYGPPVKPYQPEGIWDVVGLPEGNTRNYKPSVGQDLYRRSIYTFWKRMAPPPNMEVFNAPSREVCAVRRERTNTPLQALVTLNDPTFFEAARVLATRCLSAARSAGQMGNDDFVLSVLAELALSRSLQVNEQAILLSNKDQFLAFYQAHPDDALELLKVGESTVDGTIDANLLAAWTMVCNEVLNLDETLNK